LNQLRALLVTCPEPLRAELRSLTRARLLRRCRELEPERTDDPELRSTLQALRLLAARVESLTAETRELEQELRAEAEQIAPALLAERGIGPIGAAQALVSWSHKGRFRSEAAFARLAGAPPIPASSGKTVRHRPRPRRRPQAQQRLASDRDHQAQTRPAHDRLHRASPPRAQERTRGDPLAQALPRTPPLPTARDNDDPNLTLIEASFTHILMGRQMPSRAPPPRPSVRSNEPLRRHSRSGPFHRRSPTSSPTGCRSQSRARPVTPLSNRQPP